MISFFFVLLSTIVLVVSTLLEDSHRNDPNCKILLIFLLSRVFPS